ncbi:MAG: Single-stranded DNA-binding protein [Parcubacteria group bacterium GW2011_GWB1_41_6]|nr:MAG: Single-stranded DNA-binding protein [Parcubacteria group bacterium GW2011_GWB1_41_6]KKS34499.1 MAG: Single-stranded DNA-binding protein [Parcubacteria group bacterium GW2011_GWC2_42_13]KKS58212.1 MAG: Single-stranded DNA-binding protein [Parcubacteria group bacterium GW2011_GWA2_42_35]KKS70958.1 MAG: Single-stranded DNA-binding protein [Parcubacteria group bacterium GW2011_GWF2_42_7]
MNLNKIFLIGNLTRDPELRTLPSGQPVVSFGLATNRVWNDKQGTKQQDTQFHNVVLFGRLAEIAKQYLTKGSMTFIEGRVQTRNWQAQDGSKKTKTEIIAERLQLGPRFSRPGQDSQFQTAQPQEKEKQEKLDVIEYPEEDVNPEDIPF